MDLSTDFIRWTQIVFKILLAFKNVDTLKGPPIEPFPFVINGSLTLRCSYDQMRELIHTDVIFTHVADMWIEKLQAEAPDKEASTFFAGVTPMENSRKDRSRLYVSVPGHISVKFEGIQGTLEERGRKECTAIILTISKASCMDIGVYEFHLSGRNGSKAKTAVNLTTWLYLDTIKHTPQFLKVFQKRSSDPGVRNLSLACTILTTVKDVTLEFKTRRVGGHELNDPPFDTKQLHSGADTEDGILPEALAWKRSPSLGSCVYYRHIVLINVSSDWPMLHTNQIVCTATVNLTGQKRDGTCRQTLEVSETSISLAGCNDTANTNCSLFLSVVKGDTRDNNTVKEVWDDFVLKLDLPEYLFMGLVLSLIVILLCILLTLLCKKIRSTKEAPIKSMSFGMKDEDVVGRDADDDDDNSSSSAFGFSTSIDRKYTFDSDDSIYKGRSYY